MQQKVENTNMCFVCGIKNPIGLKINFKMDGEICFGEFTGTENHVGWNDTIHGGIIYSVLDDVTANLIYQLGRKAHTAKSSIRYRKPLFVGEKINLRSWIIKEKNKLTILKGEARRNIDNTLIADCESSFIDSV
jgi:acyl-coenzyme A thioesterase PaaI-like protein